MVTRKIIRGICLLLLLLTGSHGIYAVEFQRFGQDYRALAMGNTGIASATNSAVLFYNPAVMANITGWWVDYLPIEVALSDDAIELFQDSQDGGFDLDTQQKQFDFMDEQIGKKLYVKTNFKLDSGLLTNPFNNMSANLVINFNKMGFTFAANKTYESVLNVAVRNPSLPEIHASIRHDLIQQAGVSLPIGMGKWILGFTYKQVQRKELQFVYGMGDAIEEKPFPTIEDDGVEGTGSGYDIGLLYRLPNKARMVIGAVWRKEIKLDDATAVPGELAVGIAMTHEFGIFRWTLAADMRDLSFQQGSKGDKSLNRRLHAGTELGLFPMDTGLSFLTVRAGYNQGYYSAGAEITFSRAWILGYTLYTEETGEFAGQSPSARKVFYSSFGF
ncbi:MAG: hypothetical protein COB67_02230 [SAR324 cluster bacterium]|uniref:DUF5723 domain-containing protein n=1 Tax=SAR324 cluster bacterium TaxID=2024889 RepID=A0A2A4T9U5_9DELT|nr:MAG: hypothetical protein COB67_02230 [SAR324 cluster bacterium]